MALVTRGNNIRLLKGGRIRALIMPGRPRVEDPPPAPAVAVTADPPPADPGTDTAAPPADTTAPPDTVAP